MPPDVTTTRSHRHPIPGGWPEADPPHRMSNSGHRGHFGGKRWYPDANITGQRVPALAWPLYPKHPVPEAYRKARKRKRRQKAEGTIQE